tara:strand:- start:99 stop:305 length:207 start_codon:yes stop_codon:yes gene_type:complete
MSKIVTVVKTNLSRCDYKISLIVNGSQTQADEIKGDAGQAAAFALNLQSRHAARRIVAPLDVMSIINS